MALDTKINGSTEIPMCRKPIPTLISIRIRSAESSRFDFAMDEWCARGAGKCITRSSSLDV